MSHVIPSSNHEATNDTTTFLNDFLFSAVFLSFFFWMEQGLNNRPLQTSQHELLNAVQLSFHSPLTLSQTVLQFGYNGPLAQGTGNNDNN